MGVWSTRVSRA
ncbi:hypothetical protein F383_39257 [Gossypium arboreum]|uniref:Uncharacterized protein n=1 Tax=Gossypium arboreum TaxID=29729 RepID=A0A0B0MLA9_GOSAR|nr:hypothetical protein F383_39257 [Gossypium arboreum]